MDNDGKIDSAKILINLYDVKYTSSGDYGRLHSICELNKIESKDMLNDKEEFIAFNSKEFIKLYQSTLGKIDILSSLLERVLDESLKTNASWNEKNTIHPIVFIKLVKNH